METNTTKRETGQNITIFILLVSLFVVFSNEERPSFPNWKPETTKLETEPGNVSDEIGNGTWKRNTTNQETGQHN